MPNPSTNGVAATALICTRLMRFSAFGVCLFALGCTSHINKVIPQNLKTMDQIYDEKATSGGAAAMRLRQAEIQARPIAAENYSTPLPPNIQQIQHLYPALPNPELFMYVRPHVVGDSGAAIPAYFTRFTMYERTQYSMPGESLGSVRPMMHAIEVQQEQVRVKEEKRKKARKPSGSKY